MANVLTHNTILCVHSARQMCIWVKVNYATIQRSSRTQIVHEKTERYMFILKNIVHVKFLNRNRVFFYRDLRAPYNKTFIVTRTITKTFFVNTGQLFLFLSVFFSFLMSEIICLFPRLIFCLLSTDLNTGI